MVPLYLPQKDDNAFECARASCLSIKELKKKKQNINIEDLCKF